MIVVDASVSVSVSVPVDTFHARSVAWLRSVRAAMDDLAAPNIVLAEVAGAVARRTKSAEAGHEALRALRRISRLDILTVDESLADQAANVAANLGLRGADAVYVALADRLGCPIVTWDDEMIRKTSGVIEARQPSA